MAKSVSTTPTVLERETDASNVTLADDRQFRLDCSLLERLEAVLSLPGGKTFILFYAVAVLLVLFVRLNRRFCEYRLPIPEGPEVSKCFSMFLLEETKKIAVTAFAIPSRNFWGMDYDKQTSDICTIQRMKNDYFIYTYETEGHRKRDARSRMHNSMEEQALRNSSIRNFSG